MGGVPHHLAVVADGMAAGHLHAVSGLDVGDGAVGGIGSILDAFLIVIVAVIPLLSQLPQDVAAVRTGGNQHRLRAVQLGVAGPGGKLTHGGAVGGDVILAGIAQEDVHGVLSDGGSRALTGAAVGGQVAGGGLRQVGHIGAGGILAQPAGPGGQVEGFAAVGEGVAPRLVVVNGQTGPSGVGVAVVQSHQPPLAVHQDELVEGVGHIALVGHHVVIAVGDGHIGLAHREGQIGLVVQPVAGLVHLMAGTHIEVAVVLVAPQAAGIKGDGGVGPPQAGLAQAVPVLVVLHHPDDLGVVVLTGVLLAENHKVVVLTGIEAAPQVQLHLQIHRGDQLEIAVVGLGYQPGIGAPFHKISLGIDDFDTLEVFHPHQVVAVLVQVGVNGHRPVAVVGAAGNGGFQGRRFCGPGRRQHGDRHGQNTQTGKQAERLSFHCSFSFS